MQFEQQAQWDLYTWAREYFAREFDEIEENVDAPEFVLELNEVPLLVLIGAAGPSRASITFITHLGDGLKITPTVADFLLRTNHDLAFGTLGLNAEDTITFTHVIMGEGLLDESLTLLIHLLADAANEINKRLAESSPATRPRTWPKRRHR